jgi:glycosyltransferase involved in cell wall biosynthesis
MDDDLQHPPEEILKLIQAIKEDNYYDVVIGYPKKKKHNLFRNFLSKIANRLNSYFFDKPKDLHMGSFRIIKRNIIDIITNIYSPNFVLDPTLFIITKRIKNVEVRHDKRKHGKSQYNLSKLIRMGFDNISMNSTLPLRIVSILGIITALVSFGYGFFIVYRWIIDEILVPGWTSIMLALLFFSGLILISMGIIGEYLIRIIRATNQNFQYFIREKEIE